MKSFAQWLFGTPASRIRHELEVTQIELRETLYMKKCLEETEVYLRAKINDLQQRAVLARETC